MKPRNFTYGSIHHNRDSIGTIHMAETGKFDVLNNDWWCLLGLELCVQFKSYMRTVAYFIRLLLSCKIFTIRARFTDDSGGVHSCKFISVNIDTNLIIRKHSALNDNISTHMNKKTERIEISFCADKGGNCIGQVSCWICLDTMLM